jgi:hypothetical protein
MPHLPWCVLARSRILTALSLGASSRRVLNVVPTSNTVPTTCYAGNRRIPRLPWCVLLRSCILIALSLGASSRLANLSQVWVHRVSRPSPPLLPNPLALDWVRERQLRSSTMVHGVLRRLHRCWEKAFKIGFCSGLLLAVLLGVRGSSTKRWERTIPSSVARISNDTAARRIDGRCARDF